MTAPSTRFTVLIPARLASTRLPNKPLADLHGKPMVVRVAERARLSGAEGVVVAADSERIQQACLQHGVDVVMTRLDHASGSDRLAEASLALGLPDSATVVNVQGDEPLIEPELIDHVAALLHASPSCVMSTAACAIQDAQAFANPNVVKVVVNAASQALYFSRAPIPWWRDAPVTEAPAAGASPPLNPGVSNDASHPVLRHVGIYGYRVGFLRQFPNLAVSPLERIEALEQLRVLWHGERIAVHQSPHAPAPGVDTPEDLERVRQWLVHP